MAVFACIAEEGSITGASRRLELPKSSVSLKLKELEEQLGVRLFQRTTRRLTLTEHGSLFLEQCREMIEAGDAATRTMQGLQNEPRGTLKITCPYGMSDGRIPQVIKLFSERYPRIKLQVLARNERVDLVKEGIDIALRLGVLEDSSLIARKVTTCTRWPLASPDYLARHAPPVAPDDLARHRCIVSAYTPRWSFTRGKQLQTVSPSPFIRVTDVGMAKQLAIAGLGICMLPDMILNREIEDGLLVPLLRDYPMERRDLNLLYPSRKLQSSSVKRFIETTLEVFSNPQQAGFIAAQ
ncbi:MAG: LysR family transcriptional regulator [Pseudomonadota bacterium]